MISFLIRYTTRVLISVDVVVVSDSDATVFGHRPSSISQGSRWCTVCSLLFSFPFLSFFYFWKRKEGAKRWERFNNRIPPRTVVEIFPLRNETMTPRALSFLYYWHPPRTGTDHLVSVRSNYVQTAIQTTFKSHTL